MDHVALTKKRLRELQRMKPHTPKQPPGTVEVQKTEDGVVFYVEDTERNDVWGWALGAYDPTEPSGTTIVDFSTNEVFMDGDTPLAQTMENGRKDEGVWQDLAVFGAGIITGKTFFKGKLHSIQDCASALMAIREFLEKRRQYRQTPQVLRAIDDLASLVMRMGG